MSIGASMRLVIDADVAHAAGGKNAKYPTPTHCRDFLEAVRVIRHRIVMTDEIKMEWAKHMSSFTRTWLYKMYGAKNVEFVDDASNTDLRRKIRRAASCEKDCQAMIKDVHLLEAAQVTDKTIISMDETVHVLFMDASSRVGEIKAILWANPDEEDGETMRWLEDGAGQKDEWMLGQDRIR
jgi:hypothetical protein